MEDILLDIKNLSVSYENESGIIHAVNDVSLTLRRGESLGLVGETGAGKTTIAMSIMRLIDPQAEKEVKGSIIFEGKDLIKTGQKQMQSIRGQKISMIFQDPMSALDPIMSIEDQLEEAIYKHKDISMREAHAEALAMLEKVGISAKRGVEYPHQFSGGMKQRVIIAMALACSPQLLLADEPTTALDVTIQQQVLEMMADLREELNTTMLLITHDLGIVAENCENVATMYAGEIVEYGTVEAVFEKPLHPYTIGLFGALPRLDVKVDRLTPVDGLMPDPTCLPDGCYFCPRCKYATEACENMHPQLMDLGEGHLVRCHHAAKIAGISVKQAEETSGGAS